MKQEKKSIIIFLGMTLLLLSFYPLHSSEKKDPLTVAESSDFTATSRYSDVMSFIRALQEKSSLLRVETLCVSPEGREVPLLVIGQPVPSSPLALNHDKRAVLYIQANIHAGEVEGKEASLMLARDILLQEKPPYLDKLVILIAPIFNADGNEKIDPNNRRRQAGPEKGVGVRYNGQNLDLNRDGMKLESPEVQGLVRNILNKWDPFLLVDCHTTNGSYHQEPVTYIWALNPNGDLPLIEYMREKMMPSINKNLKQKYDVLSVPYGNFIDYRDPEKGWRPSGPEPRYITNYIGLRNRMAILNENYSYAEYKTRVMGCYYFLHSILEYCHTHTDEITQLIRQADQRTIQRGLRPTEKDTLAVEYDLQPLKEKVTVLGYEMEVIEKEGSRPQIRRTDKPKAYSVPFFTDFVPKRSVSFPFAYLIPTADPEIIHKLLQHGLLVEKLTKPAKLEVESFRITEIKGAERLYQGHRMNSVKGEYNIEEKEFPVGTLFISTAQPLANVAAYLLEPESDDGLLVWNFFDRYVVPQWGRGALPYPVYKLLKPANLVKERVK
ncbi:MAG: M14 family metallopeptidase [Candidatus Aminicenantes bacterium]|nr:MAG: M14 family metallopeptidase [Candidatus Aminicenantes bacterium]